MDLRSTSFSAHRSQIFLVDHSGNWYVSFNHDSGRGCEPLLWGMLPSGLTSSSASACSSVSGYARQASSDASPRDGSVAIGRALGIRDGDACWRFGRSAKTRLSARNVALPTADSLCSRSSHSSTTLVQPGSELGRGTLSPPLRLKVSSIKVFVGVSLYFPPPPFTLVRLPGKEYRVCMSSLFVRLLSLNWLTFSSGNDDQS